MPRHPSAYVFSSQTIGRRAVRLAAIAVAGAALTNCSSLQSSLDQDGGPPGNASMTNACFEEAPCLGGVCSEEGFCQSERTALPALLLEVTAPAGTPSIAGVRFMQEVPEIPPSGHLDVGLGNITHIKVGVSGIDIPDEQCVVPASPDVPSGNAPDGTMSARVTLIPRESLLGIPSPTYAGALVPDEASTYEVLLLAPPGHYDIHVEPLGMDAGCVRSPYLFVDQEVPAENDVELNLQLPIPAKLDLTLVYPGFIDVLSDWQVDIIHRATGKVLSNRVVLKDPVGLGEAIEYRAALAFSPVYGDSSAPATELIRLSPPESVTAPTVYLERSVVELFEAGKGVIDQLTELPSPVTYTGRVNRRDDATPAPGTVTLVATELAATSPGLIAAFSRTVKTDASGVFEVDLLPGKYQVLMEPQADDLAQTVTELSVSSGAGNQAGKVLEVGLRANIAGSLVTVSGAPVLGVPVEAYPPAVSRSMDVISAARSIDPLVPRAELVPAVNAYGQLVDTGTFSLLADPGTFHVIARPEVSTGFAWGLALGLEVEDDNVGLADIVVSPPFVLEGQINSSDVGLVSGALVRAYAYVDGSAFAKSAEEATSVVAVGEARVDASGHYRLLLPSVTP
jgi:hypothetical protein